MLFQTLTKRKSFQGNSDLTHLIQICEFTHTQIHIHTNTYTYAYTHIYIHIHTQEHELQTYSFNSLLKNFPSIHALSSSLFVVISLVDLVGFLEAKLHYRKNKTIVSLMYVRAFQTDVVLALSPFISHFCF